MVKAIFRLLSSAALLAAVVIGAKTADKIIKEIKGEKKDEDIIDI